MRQESGTNVFMTLDKTSQERLLVLGIMAATETANEGKMHAGRMVQEMKSELSEAERTLLGHQRVDRQVQETEESVTVHDAIKLLGRRILISHLLHAQVVIQHPALTEARHFSRHVDHQLCFDSYE